MPNKNYGWQKNWSILLDEDEDSYIAVYKDKVEIMMTGRPGGAYRATPDHRAYNQLVSLEIERGVLPTQISSRLRRLLREAAEYTEEIALQFLHGTIDVPLK
jgi:hypothetical protein